MLSTLERAFLFQHLAHKHRKKLYNRSLKIKDRSFLSETACLLNIYLYMHSVSLNSVPYKSSSG